MRTEKGKVKEEGKDEMFRIHQHFRYKEGEESQAEKQEGRQAGKDDARDGKGNKHSFFKKGRGGG